MTSGESFAPVSVTDSGPEFNLNSFLNITFAPGEGVSLGLVRE